MSYNNIYFYNNFHNGDVFYSREFVRDIMNKINSKYYYIHSNDFSILKDFPIEQINITSPDNNSFITIKDNDLFINTWIGNSRAKYLLSQCSLLSNYRMYSDIYKELGLEIDNIESYIPNVNFEFVNKENIDKSDISDSILICNNNVLSGQAHNFNFDPIIDSLSDKFKDKKFIITNNTNIIKDNVMLAENIIGYSNNNLLEISYLSRKTNIIIGRASGPFCFTHIKDNINDENKIFICFASVENNCKWIPDKYSKAKQYWSSNYSNIIEYIEKIIINNE